MTNQNTQTVKSVETMFTILELIMESNGVNALQIAEELELAKSTVYRYLNTLLNMGYITKENEQFYVGLRFLHIGKKAKRRRNEWVLAESKVNELAETTQERVQFVVEEHGQGVLVHTELGEKAFRGNPSVGHRVPLHATSAGKAILAHFSDESVEKILNTHGLESVTDETIINKSDLFDELEEVREKKYSVQKHEHIEGVHSVGVPILTPDGNVLGAISVTGPSHRLNEDVIQGQLVDLLLGTKNEFELTLAQR
jgi:DNA-binding IclR family transcriptional regulator